MLISTRGRYALRVLIDLAEHRAQGYIPLKEIAERQDISEKYLESIIKILVKASLVTGLRGKGGGYCLRSEPEQISVLEILEHTEGDLAPVACLEAGAQMCEKQQQCRTRTLWQGLDRVIRTYLEQYTIADLLQAAEPGDHYVI